jgi:hypothetical protein
MRNRISFARPLFWQATSGILVAALAALLAVVWR